MREQRTELKVYRVELICDENGCAGRMVRTGQSFTTVRTEIEHKCDACGRTAWLAEAYPGLAYEERP